MDPSKSLPIFLFICAAYLVSPATSVGATWPTPPVWTEKAAMARYLIHYADWGIVSAISSDLGHQPYGTLQSFCDGTTGNSTGYPFFYIADISDTGKNIKYNNTVSFSVSQAMSDYCETQGLDPEEPLCSRLTLTGQVIPVKDEMVPFVKNALFTKHPAMKNWPSSHSWRFYMLKITGVYLLDFYGGRTHVPLSEYFKTPPPKGASQKLPTKTNDIF